MPKFNLNSRDGQEMKIYIETGCTDGLKPAQFIEKFPQFKKYSKEHINKTLWRLRKDFKAKLDERGAPGPCEYYIKLSVQSLW